MQAIALNVTHLPVVVTKLGTMRICGVEIIERPNGTRIASDD